MESKKSGVAKLIIALILIAFFVFTSIYGLGDSGSLKSIKQGLDLAGGVSITYEPVNPEEATKQQIDDTRAKLEKKAMAYSTEAEVYLEGTNRINIDIPGEKDANAILKKLGSLGNLEFTDEEGNVLMTGDDVANAAGQTYVDNNTGARKYVVQLTWKTEAVEKFRQATSDNVGKRIIIYYDGQTISSPMVNEVIESPTCEISGMEDMEEADILAQNIRNGALPLELREVRSNVVGASLGSDAIRTSLIAAAIGLAIVIIFMIAYYRVPGIAASLALVFYSGFMIFVLSAFEVTLTLSGIAGIVLSVGMAVDANVIIFARIREEIGKGKSVASAIKLGYSKALSAIIDGNITTLIAAAVLYFLCSGTIRGFAITLALGIVVSMISCLLISRLLLEGMYALGLKKEGMYGKTVYSKSIDFVGKKTVFFAIAAVLILVGIGAAVYNVVDTKDGEKKVFNYSIEFSGGTSTEITMPEAMTIEQIEEKVTPVVKEATGVSDVRATTVEGSTSIILKTASLSLEQRTALYDAMEETFSITEDDIKTENISATIGSEMRKAAIISVIVASILILAYVWVRFKDVRFGVGSIAALVHDVLIVCGAFVLFRWSVGNTFIACVLTIVGYSINASIVVFDRVRENLADANKNTSIADIVNLSITQSVTRSINTSVTTLVMVVVLYIIGVTAIKDFALPLMIGLIAGTFSSVCLAGPMWFVMKKIGADKKAQ